MHKGSCQCGAVSFEVDGELGAPDACHCSICRKLSGHYYVGTEVSKDTLAITGSENLTWFQSSGKVRRGFCSTCGASRSHGGLFRMTGKVRRGFCSTCGAPMFFEPIYRDWISISMGVLDNPTGVKLALHIFVDDKGDYYEITDGLPQNAQ